MKTTITATEAKQSFWSVLKDAEYSPVAITKRNRACAYVISAEQFEDYKQLEEYEDIILSHLAEKALAWWMASEEETKKMNSLIFW